MFSDFNGYFPLGGSTDVVIENSAGTNSNGLVVTDGATVALSGAKLRITNAGHAGVATAAVSWSRTVAC